MKWKKKTYSRILTAANRLNLVIKTKAWQIYLNTGEKREKRRKRKLEEKIKIVTQADTYLDINTNTEK